MTEISVGVLILLASAFVFVSALGLLRMPDLYMRMHAATKAGTLGAGFMLVALAVFFSSLGVVVKALAVIAFLLLTAPVAAHILGRAGYLSGADLWEGTQFDEFEAYSQDIAPPAAQTDSATQTDSAAAASQANPPEPSNAQ